MNRSLAIAAVGGAVAGISALPRILAQVTPLPGVLWLFSWSDLVEIWRDSTLSGHRLPYFDVGFAYPPLIGYVSGVFSLVVTDVRGFMLAWAVVLAVVAAAGGFVLATFGVPRRALFYWACAPQMLLFASINFDVLAAVAVTCAAVLVRRRRSTEALVATAVAIAIKLFPAALVPAILLRMLQKGERQAAAAAALLFTVVLAALYIPAALGQHSTLAFAGQYAYGKAANLDSIWAIPAATLEAAGVPSELPILVITLTGLGLSYVLLTLPRAVRSVDPVVGFALVTVTVLFWSRFYSPQYSIWLLPFFVLLPLRVTTFILLSLADVGVFIGVSSLTLLPQSGGPSPAFFVLLAGSVALRQVGLVIFWRETMELAADRVSTIGAGQLAWEGARR